ncbi:MAG TPA: iron-containing alcohol dehydrogenase [Pyrinomonadaceae bacterium]|nr:iron-containing alcohol dehydrogenase [Pyrinomonadaceae bacterium]
MSVLNSFDYKPGTRVIFGVGSLARLGELATELGFHRTLLVADRGLVASGHVDEALEPLRAAQIEVVLFHDFETNPDSAMIEAGTIFARAERIDSLIGLGGGSSMDCAKGINFLLTNGGRMADYRGYGKTRVPLLPMIGIPTTSGTGSEAQSFALISDSETHIKMACGDPGAAFRVALLDPVLTVSQPRIITATSGFDALAHAIETFVTTKHNAVSDLFSREAWRLLESNYESVLTNPGNLEVRGAMQLGAYYAGLAIENSMLGATHACANPLTTRYGTPHGEAIAMLLPTVVRWNESAAANRYKELLQLSRADKTGPQHSATEALAQRLEQLAAAGGLHTRLSKAGISDADFSALAADAAEQWTGTFNPRKFNVEGALEVYRCAY